MADDVEVDLENTPVEEWCGSTLNKGGACALPNTRHSFNAHVSRQDLIETFAPAFERAAEAHAGAIMCSYSKPRAMPWRCSAGLTAAALQMP